MKDKTEDENTLIFDSIPEPDIDMHYVAISTPLIKYFVSTTRSSFEYKMIIQYMKNFMDLDSCAFFNEYSMKNGFIIELHHSPFTMYDICETVANKQLITKNFIKTMDVCEEVAKLHYEFKVGLVPLNPTAHKLIHSEALSIHPSIIYGDWKSFYEEYKEYCSEVVHEKYKIAISMSENDITNPEVFTYSPTKIIVKNQKHLVSVDINALLTEKSKEKLKKLEIHQ